MTHTAVTPITAATRGLAKLKKDELVTGSMTAQVAVGILAAKLAYERRWGEHAPSREEMEAAREQLDADTAVIADAVMRTAAGIVAAE